MTRKSDVGFSWRFYASRATNSTASEHHWLPPPSVLHGMISTTYPRPSSGLSQSRLCEPAAVFHRRIKNHGGFAGPRPANIDHTVVPTKRANGATSRSIRSALCRARRVNHGDRPSGSASHRSERVARCRRFVIVVERQPVCRRGVPDGPDGHRRPRWHDDHGGDRSRAGRLVRLPGLPAVLSRSVSVTASGLPTAGTRPKAGGMPARPAPMGTNHPDKSRPTSTPPRSERKLKHPTGRGPIFRGYSS